MTSLAAAVERYAKASSRDATWLHVLLFAVVLLLVAVFGNAS